jgi:hypothetical protein
MGQTLVKNLIKLLNNYALRWNFFVYVKDEGSNLNIMNITIKSIVSCDMLGLEESFRALVFGIHFPRLANMLQTQEKVCKDLRYVWIKFVQGNLQQCITKPKKIGKGRQKWENTCVNLRFLPQKLNILMKIR